MNKFKKIISLTLITSQIGCANHVVHSSLSNAVFDLNYSYTIKTNQNMNFPNVAGASIQNLPDRIYITQNNQTKYLLHNQITAIDGESYQTTGSYAGIGAGIGAGLGAGVGLVAFISELVNPSEYDPESLCEEGGHECNLMIDAVAGVIFAAIGAGIGAGIGAAIPKKSQIQITPTFSSSSNNMGAGANLSVRF